MFSKTGIDFRLIQCGWVVVAPDYTGQHHEIWLRRQQLGAGIWGALWEVQAWEFVDIHTKSNHHGNLNYPHQNDPQPEIRG